MKKAIVCLLLVVMLLSLASCGGGGLSTYFGVSKGNITSLSVWSSGRSKTIDAENYALFMKTFDVEYTGVMSAAGLSKAGSEYQVKYEGAEYALFLLPLTDGRVLAQQYDGVVTIYYVSVEPVEIPSSLK